MNFYHYLKHFERNNQHQAHLIDELHSRLKIAYFQKGDYLLKPGEICKYVYVVEFGLFRYFNIEQQTELTTGFAGSLEIAYNLPSLLLHNPSKTGIVCETDSKTLKISYLEWQALEDLSPAILQFSKQLGSQLLLDQELRFQQLRNASTSEKYRYLCEQYKGFANLISQRKIASYLNISPPALSTLLKAMLMKR